MESIFLKRVAIVVFTIVTMNVSAYSADKVVTIQVHATECKDAPAKGAKVVIIDTGWEDNLASGTTNSAGDCSMKVRAGYNIVVQVTYKGKVKKSSYFATDDNYGKQIVEVIFDDNCNGYNLTERLTVKLKDETKEVGYFYLSYDNYGIRSRIDADFPDGQKTVMIDDELKCAVYAYDSDIKDGNPWSEIASESCNPDQKDMRRLYVEIDAMGYTMVALYGGYPVCFANSDEAFKRAALFFTRGSDTNVNGKLCQVYTSKITGAVIYKWGKYVMRLISGGKVIYEALAIAEDVPDTAFKKGTVEHNWIK